MPANPPFACFSTSETGSPRCSAGQRRLLAPPQYFFAVRRAGDDRNPHRLVGDEIIPYLRHLDVTGWMQRVHSLGAIEGNVGDVFALVVFDEFEFHLGAPLNMRNL